MNCEKVDYQTIPYLEGDLNLSDRIRMEEHLKICEPCRDRFDNIKATWETLDLVKTTKLKPELYERIIAKMKPHKLQTNRYHLSPLVSAAIIIIGLLIGSLTTEIIKSTIINNNTADYDISLIFNEIKLEQIEYISLSE